jgi:hypothetical protein
MYPLANVETRRSYGLTAAMDVTVIVFPSTFPLTVTFWPANLSNWLLVAFQDVHLVPAG